jgi:RluA family pseudouridine synthase
MLEPKTIYEDAEFLAIDKPSGMLVDQVRALGKMLPEDRSRTLAGWLEIHHPGAQLVHRLDKETSGVILAAKNPASYEYFKDQFKGRTMRKTYIALVAGHIQEPHGTIDAPIGIRHGMVRHTTHKSAKHPSEAITDYSVVTYYTHNRKPYTLVEARPKTGRTHQIRVHFNSIHHPVMGDKLYGGKVSEGLAARHLLHAQRIEFTKPDGGRISIESEIPADFAAVLSTLKKVEIVD